MGGSGVKRFLLTLVVAALVAPASVVAGAARAAPGPDSQVGATTATAAAHENSCADGVDNDGDGLVDGADPDCREPTVRRCADGVDNDGDGLVDGSDPGCKSPDDDDEFDRCADGVDNDGDGLVDGADPDCEPGSGGEQKTPACADGVDNDGDGLVDLADPGCRDAGDRSERFSCEDGIDNDGDGRIDFPADPGCSSATDNSEGGEPAAESCADGIDNDRDGLTDGDDPDCEEPGQPPKPACSDGVDNDGDGKVDAADPGCSSPEDDDETDPPAPDPCSTPAGDPGLLGNGTIAQQAYDSGLNALPILEDPDANGLLSNPIYTAGNGTPLEPLTDEGACLLSLPAGADIL
jgi:hypothetical protein